MRCAAFLVMVGVLAPVAKAELRPDEVAILAMAESEQSRKLAEHYAQARKVPKSHILLLPGKPAVTISREAWETQFQPAVRTWLGEKKLEQKIRCLVTCWDVPLRIERRSSQSPVVVARLRELSRYRGLLVRQLGEMIQTVDGIAPEAKPPQRPKWDANTPVADLTAKFEGALQAAQQRAKGLKSEAERQQASATLEKIFAAGGGLSALLRAVAGSTDVSKLKPELVQRLELIKGQVQGMAEGLQALNNLPDTVARDVQMLNLVQKSAGLIGAVQWIDQQLELLKKNETAASFDSELSLLLWPDYPLFG